MSRQFKLSTTAHVQNCRRSRSVNSWRCPFLPLRQHFQNELTINTNSLTFSKQGQSALEDALQAARIMPGHDLVVHWARPQRALNVTVASDSDSRSAWIVGRLLVWPFLQPFCHWFHPFSSGFMHFCLQFGPI